MHQTRSIILIIQWLFLASMQLSAPVEAGKESIQEKIRSTDWAGIRGANFIPSYASNTYEIWRNYDHEVFDRQLRLVQAVGYNSVRLWLNSRVYEELGEAMVDRVEDALRLCAKHKLKAVIVMFDACGARPRKDARWVTASEAFDYFQSSPQFSQEQKQYLQQLFGSYAKGHGANRLVPLGSDSPMMILLWENWQATPGNDGLGTEWYPKLEAYVEALLRRLKDHPNLLLWDLMNEPEFADEGPFTPSLMIRPEVEKRRDAFLSHFRQYVQRQYPDEIVSIGWARLDNCKKYADLVDVLTFHVYRGPEELQRTIEQALTYSKKTGKQILITETLANWDFGSPQFPGLTSDEQQLGHYQEVLPVLIRARIGWMAWGMMVSRCFEPFTGILYPNGLPRPAALYLEKMLKGAVKQATRNQ